MNTTVTSRVGINDDCPACPFNARSTPKDVYAFGGDLLVSRLNGGVYVAGVHYRLTRMQTAIIAVMAERQERTLTRAQLMLAQDNVNIGRDRDVEDKITDIFICKIRKRLKEIPGEPFVIRTCWGVGYSLCRSGAPGHTIAAQLDAGQTLSAPH